MTTGPPSPPTQPPDPASPGADTASDEAPADIRTFLIADVRGYTRFTQEHGDVAGARLVRTFATLVSEEATAGGGVLLELRGDEALLAFESPRRALRTAVSLQARFEQEIRAEPTVPLNVGIGLDVGEAVAVEGGYRGGALNLAARLCALAAAGEILASEGVVHLARKVPGIEFRERRPVRLKGLSEPVRLVEVRREGALRTPPQRRARQPVISRRRALIVGSVALALSAGSAATAIVLTRSPSGLSRIDFSGVGAIEPRAARIVAEVIPSTSAGHLATDGNIVWTANPADDTVSQIDPSTTTVVNTIPVGSSPSGIAVGGGAVWVANTLDGTVSRIDPRAHRVVQTVSVGHGPSAVAFGAGKVWVTNAGDRTVSSIDPRTGRVRATISSDADGHGIAVGAGSLWVIDQSSDSVAELDPRAGNVVRMIRTGTGPVAIAWAFGSVWVANAFDGTISRIDAHRAIVTATIDVGGSPIALAAAAGQLWVADGSARELDAIDPARNAVARRIGVGSPPLALAAGSKTLWLSVQAAPASHRGGTLRMVSPLGGLDSLDPAMANAIGTSAVLSLTNDGLVTFKRSGGSEGAAIVPDLATSLPAPAHGGLSYTFELRRGIRYSNGARVSPADFRFALERDFELHSPGAHFYTALVGAARCSAKPGRCDLSRGVVDDPGSGTVTFHLTVPDPELLYKLALPFAYPLPETTTPRRAVTRPLPATGPYKIVRYEPHRAVVLVRNPTFREWSAAAQPEGYPDRIVWDATMTIDAATTAIERGRADVMLAFGPPAKRLTEINTLYASQVHSHPYPGALYVFLNARLPPFDDLRVRQALNFALDRNEFVQLQGGTQVAEPTCQVLPPLIPGYRAYCPYTRGPNASGAWLGPDLAQAQALVAASGTRGASIVLWSLASEPYKSEMEYVARVLRTLGYRVSLRMPGDATYFARIYDPASRPQAGFQVWIADYPAPSDFLLQFRCSRGQKPNDLNLSGLCDAAADRMMARALKVETTDAQAANRTWARVDRRVVDRAAYAPMYVPRAVDLVSRRIGNYQFSPRFGVLIDQLWVR